MGNPINDPLTSSSASTTPTTSGQADSAACQQVLTVENDIAQAEGSTPPPSAASQAQSDARELVSLGPSTTFASDVASVANALANGSGGQMISALVVLDQDCAQAGDPHNDPLESSG